MEAVIISICRTTTALVLLLIVAYHFGKQIGTHKNYFTFALSITLGSFTANMGFDLHLKFIPLLLSFFTLILIYYILATISYRSVRLRKWFAGKPTIIIENGILLEENMKKHKYTLDNLNQQLRELGIFNIDTVSYALLEVNGKLSVLKKEEYQGVLKKDLAITSSQILKFPLEIIMEGNLITENFTEKYTLLWLEKELNKKNLIVKDINYAVISTSGQLYIDQFDDQMSPPFS
ncbi:DUF421 domain-containing protein [Neobacillus ginsengisoli]|uniref:Uncharacterized membrane protein YcaP (DUF421 family) n=1 Tax=Neobacillus ginsengisoli TaxID=904295 RepID=A0ABT9XQA9_9BACI|nr:DUF421 domain-containing protein [Neobacillus ginsengisoli]MDQ0197735.1 uncharacterized membrane protein YcaP (DUF421 family) [Neobacillus ginsengisoli]